MPRYDADRNAFVARIDRRRRWVGRAAHLLKRLGLLRKPVQTVVYEHSFRSDAEVVSYAYAMTNDHLPDLETPRWYNEKVRWQFLNHPNPLMSLVADKIAVRSYLRHKGGAIAAPRILAFGDDPAELATAPLPPRFVLKSSFGSGQNHIEHGDTRTPRARLIAKANRWMGYDQWRSTGEFHYRDLRKRWMVEDFVPSSSGQIEYKIFCMMGAPVFILAITDRAGPKHYKRAIYDPDWKPVDFHWKVTPPIDEKAVPRPAMLDQMLADARLYAEDFLQVRVDFLQCDDRVMFSELTFASAAARVPFTPEQTNIDLGDLIDLDQAPEYLERGRRIAADLNWPVRASLPKVVEPVSSGPAKARAVHNMYG